MFLTLCVDLFVIDPVPERTEEKQENEMTVGSVGFGECGAKPGLASAGRPNNMNHHNDIRADPPITHSSNNSNLTRPFMFEAHKAPAVRSDMPQI
jgi:hypothetical protein